jgi:hypothetical protein
VERGWDRTIGGQFVFVSMIRRCQSLAAVLIDDEWI